MNTNPYLIGEGGDIVDDSKIIQLLHERSEQAIVELSKKYGKLCEKIALDILGDKSDAQECVNDAYLGVWNAIPPAIPVSLMAFVCTVTRNVSTARYYSQTAKKRNSSKNLAIDELEMLLSSESSVEDDVEVNELTKSIEEYLQSIGELDRAIFIRRFCLSQSVADIAKYFGKTSHYISVRLSRTKNELKKYLIQKGINL